MPDEPAGGGDAIVVAGPPSARPGFVPDFIRRHGWKIALWFFCLLLPLWGLAALVEDLHEKQVFVFDAPVLNALHSIASPRLDRFFVRVSQAGMLWGTVPLDVIVFVCLALRRRKRESLFFGLSIVGSAILDLAGKRYFARVRPDLWLSIAPARNFSFPSGHAMASATLSMALIVLCWPTRWRWPVFAGAMAFVVLVGTSRVYLGVHYPSDILAGWSAAIAWVFGMHVLVNRRPPPVAIGPGATPTTGGEGSTRLQ